MDQEREKYRPIYTYTVLTAHILLLLQVYMLSHPFYQSIGLSHKYVVGVLAKFATTELFSVPYYVKGIAYALIAMTHVIRIGSGKSTSWTLLLIGLVLGTALFFWYPAVLPTASPLYTMTSLVGMVLISWAWARIGLNVQGNFKRPDNDMHESFPQCNDLIETPDSVNFPIEYQYKGRKMRGWVNLIQCQRGGLIIGGPGAGKTYSVYNQMIEQMIRKGYVMFVYDFKFPDLTEIVYNELLRNYKRVKNPRFGKIPNQPEYIKSKDTPDFYVINFKDARYSHRCNPIHSRYIHDAVDSAEIADVIMKNINKGAIEKQDFFDKSGTLYIDICIFFLAKLDEGQYCTFPHLLELVAQDYKKVFQVVQQFKELETKIRPFEDALNARAMDQLAGQIASAQIPLNRMASEQLYWIMTGDDFSLDINNPEDPKIVCVGNDPKRQEIYGTVLALYTSTLFKIINDKNKRKCGVLLDELPTIFLKDLANLIATARSNKVCIWMGVQDKTQLIRDYTEKEADVIFGIVGNIICGTTNGKTAEQMSKMFGQQYVEEQSKTINMDSDSVQISYHKQDVMPVSKIETLSQGFFFGKVADTSKLRIDRKFFSGEFIIDTDRWDKKMAQNKPLPVMTSFNEEQIRRDMHTPIASANILRKWAQGEAIKQMDSFNDKSLEEKMNALIKSLTTAEIEDLLNQEAERLIIETENDILEENFNRVRQEVADIIENNLPADYDLKYNKGKGNGNQPAETDPMETLMNT